ncbi:MAG: cytochrome c biogenesis heme-transporting ATPase CcmA [Arenicellales bacterium]
MFSAKQLECVKGYDSLFKDIHFELHLGEVMRIHGTNGSGKTSLLRILTGLSLPETGEVFYNGVNIEDDCEAFNQNLTYIGHHNGLKADLSALENLQLSQEYLAKTNDISAESALEQVGLSGYEHILTHQLSAGQKRRVALARLHLSRTPLWLLDEPTTAIDVDGVKHFEQTIEQHALNGGMVMLTSHQDLSFGQANTLALNLS